MPKNSYQKSLKKKITNKSRRRKSYKNTRKRIKNG